MQFSAPQNRTQQAYSGNVMLDTLSPDLLRKMHAYWRAANYLSVGQIYLQDNPLLETPLRLEHIKPRLLGHWGTTTGLNFLYVHLNRLIKDNDLNMIYVIGPGHGGPGIVAHSYLEGSYTEHYPAIERSRNGLQRLFRQFSWPYGIPSHVSPETPGSIHEGGELGYSLAHAYGAAFDNPDLIVSCIIGDGEAETGALATSWHSNKFLNPARDGAVLPILHLNGFKIANPTVLARISRQELTELLRGYGYDPHFVEGDDPALVHQSLAGTLDKVLLQIRDIQSAARAPTNGERVKRPRWPMIVFRTAQRLDRAEIRRWQAGRRHLARAPGTDRQLQKARTCEAARRLDEELPSGGAVRRARAIPRRICLPGADRAPPHGLQSARQWR
jgi:xylulose-5-phosphate/fructose-6-phosphate phosphoketolase